MKRLNKFFTKKEKSEEPSPVYTAADSSSLSSLSNSELCSIIFKYDDEVKRLNLLTKSLTEERDRATMDCLKRTEESKLYKELSEVGDRQGVQEQLQAITMEMGDVREVLQSKKAEVELLRSQMVTLEEVNASYKRDLQTSEGKFLGLETRLQSAGGGDSSPASEEVHHLRSELNRVSLLTRDGLKFEQRCKDLEIIKKNLEAEVMKLTIHQESGNSQMKMMKEKVAEMGLKLQEAEANIQKKQGNLDNFRQEVATFSFQKESMETEIRTLKEIMTGKDALIMKKKEKLRIRKSEIARIKAEMESLKGNFEAKMKEAQSQWMHERQEMTQRLLYTEEVTQLKLEKLERDLTDKQRDLQQTSESLKSILSKCEEKDAKTAALEEQVLELLQTKKSLAIKLDTTEQESFKLKSQLDSVQRKREQARSEVIKLSQRLEQRPSPSKTELPPDLDSFFPAPVLSSVESKLISHLRVQVETVYKTLMKAMLTAKDTHYPSEDLTKDVPGLLMESGLFSEVERKLNDLVMHLHEVAEMPDVEETDSSQTWSGKITNAMANIKQTVAAVGPVKLFSCMPNMREQPQQSLGMKPKTEQGRKLMSSTGGDHRIDQQQTPPGWKHPPGAEHLRFKRF